MMTIVARAADYIEKAALPTHMCLECHSSGRPVTQRTAGLSLCVLAALALICTALSGQPLGLLVVVVLAVLGVVLWSRRGACRVCGANRCIPLDSPRGRAMASATPPAA